LLINNLIINIDNKNNINLEEKMKLVVSKNKKDNDRYTNRMLDINVIFLNALRNNNGIKRIIKKE